MLDLAYWFAGIGASGAMLLALVAFILFGFMSLQQRDWFAAIWGFTATFVTLFVVGALLVAIYSRVPQ